MSAIGALVADGNGILLLADVDGTLFTNVSESLLADFDGQLLADVMSLADADGLLWLDDKTCVFISYIIENILRPTVCALEFHGKSIVLHVL